MRYLFLPPLFGVLFVLYIAALDRQKSAAILALTAMLFVAETAKGYPALSTVVFYGLSYFTVVPKLRHAVSCKVCRNAIFVVYAYMGYWAFGTVVSQMFALAPPHLDWREVFYVGIEFFVVGLL